MRFYNREVGLKRLEALYETAKNRKQLAVIVGRKETGKTAIALEFSKNKGNVLYFPVEKKESRLLLDSFQDEVREVLNLQPVFREWHDLFRFLLEIGRRERLVVIFDEFQNFLEANGETLSAFQEFMHMGGKSKILIICLSSEIGRTAKLFTKPTFARGVSIFSRLRPFRYYRARAVLEDFGFRKEENKILVYSILGGTPGYLTAAEGLGKVEEIIRHLFLRKRAPLREEGLRLLEKLEMSDVHLSILEAMARGASTPTEIGKTIGLPPTSLSRYLGELVEENLAVRRLSVIGARQWGRYYLGDPFLRFWFSCIHRRRKLLELGEEETLMEAIKKELPSLALETLKEIVEELLDLHRGKETVPWIPSFEKVGRWWNRKGNEIDVCAVGREGGLACKVWWSEQKVDSRAVEQFLKNVKAMGAKEKTKLVLISKGGFTPECLGLADSKEILTLKLEQLGQIFDRVQTGL